MPFCHHILVEDCDIPEDLTISQWHSLLAQERRAADAAESEARRERRRARRATVRVRVAALIPST